MKKYYMDDILIIEDFITDEELSIIIKDCLDENNWLRANDEVHDKSETADYWDGKNKHVLSDETSEALDAILKRIKKELDNDLEESNTNKLLQRMFPNEQLSWALPPHADTGEHKDSKYVTRGYILYYNDNYDGGEIVYVNKDISIKPKAKMLVCHPGSEEYKHGVSKVYNGTRYMTTGFIFERSYLEQFY
jgi:hypothetical protein